MKASHIVPPDPVMTALVDFILTICLTLVGSWLFVATLDWWLP